MDTWMPAGGRALDLLKNGYWVGRCAAICQQRAYSPAASLQCRLPSCIPAEVTEGEGCTTEAYCKLWITLNTRHRQTRHSQSWTVHNSHGRTGPVRREHRWRCTILFACAYIGCEGSWKSWID